MSSPRTTAGTKKPAAAKAVVGKAVAGKRAASKPKSSVAKVVAAASNKPAPIESAADPAKSANATALAKDIERAIMAGNLDVISQEAQQALMAAIVKLYGANFESGNRYPIVRNLQALTSTDVMVACGALLKASNLQVFELGMWQSWTGR